MTDLIKQQIREAALKALTASGLSQAKFATKLGISAATMTQIKRNNIDLISDNMWNKISIEIGFTLTDWQPANTVNFQLIQNTLKVCQNEGEVFALSADAGQGKTYACEQYARSNENVIYLRCRESWNTKLFHIEFAKACGEDPAGYTTYELVTVIIRALQKRPGALVIWDEADKIRNKVILFIELYNELKGRVGFFLCGTPRLRKDIENNARRDKLGYKEVYSRLGSRFLKLNDLRPEDVEAICIANGVTDEQAIMAIWNDYMEVMDLRRVEKLVGKFKRKLNPVKAA